MNASDILKDISTPNSKRTSAEAQQDINKFDQSWLIKGVDFNNNQDIFDYLMSTNLPTVQERAMEMETEMELDDNFNADMFLVGNPSEMVENESIMEV